MIVERDQRIVKEWFEPYKYASIGQIEKAFFRDQQYSYESSRKRLIELGKAELIKIFHDVATNRNIYILNDKKVLPPSWHRMITLDVLAEMKYNSFNVEIFEVEKRWINGKIRSDALTVFIVGKYIYHFFIETQLANHSHNLEKYDILYESGEVQKYLNKSHFPRVLLISDTKYSNIKLKSTDVIQLDTKLHIFPSILL